MCPAEEMLVTQDLGGSQHYQLHAPIPCFEVGKAWREVFYAWGEKSQGGMSEDGWDG